MDIIGNAIDNGQKTLSEHESKLVLESYNIPITREMVLETGQDVKLAIQNVGLPMVMKANSPDISHKTEKGLVRTGIRDEKEALDTFNDIKAKMNGKRGGVLAQEMISGKRELVIGLMRDPQFGPCVMFGLGGIFTEILRDVSFRLAPLEKRDAMEMMAEIKARKILDAVRGMEPADKERLSEMLMNVGRIGVEDERVKEVDINPVIISGNRPVAVDALVVLQ